MRKNSIFVVVMAAVLVVAVAAHSAGGEESERGAIKIGMSAAMSGPSKALGLEMKLGLEACIDDTNLHGGISGRKLELIALDDGYEPEIAKINMRRLLDEENVVAVVGNVGTPTAAATVPIAIEARTLMFGAFTGAPLLREDPPNRYVINYRASYAQETRAMITGLLDIGIRPFEIAFFTQDDEYGTAGHRGADEALRAFGYKATDELVHARYTRNDVDIEHALLEIVSSEIPPRAVIMIGAYRPCAKFIRIARRVLPNTLFLNVSFVGSTALAADLNGKGEGVIVTQVVPYFGSDVPLAREYRKHMAGKPLGFVSFEGYIAGRIFVEGLRKARGEINRESVIDALESLGEFDIGLGLGSKLRLASERHQASDRIWLTALRDDEFIEVDWDEIKAQLSADRRNAAHPSTSQPSIPADRDGCGP